MRKFLAPLVLAAGLMAALPAAAHDEMDVAGQVTAVTAKTIQIKTAAGQLVTLDTDGNTRVMMAGQRLTLKDLKVGQSVKALGFGDSMADLQAIDVVILPAKPAKGG
jgi:hypothetical protein